MLTDLFRLQYLSLLALVSILSTGISHANNTPDSGGSIPEPGSASASVGSAPPPDASSCDITVSQGLLSRYSLDEGSGLLAHDSVGGHHALLSPSTSWSPSGGVIGGALNLRGPGSDIGVVVNAMPLLSLDQFTYCSWILPAGTPGGLFSSNAARWRGVYLLSDNPRQLGALISTTETAVIALSVPVITSDVWHHVCATYDGGTSARGIRFYHNGANLRRAWLRSGSGITTATGDYIAEFGAANSDGQRFTGSFDEILIYDRPLSAAEVSTIYRDYRACGAP